MSTQAVADAVRARIRDVPDFPKKGILFKDVTPVLEHAETFKRLIEAMAAEWKGQAIDKVVAIESRGFIFGAPLALALGAGFVIVRKPGKLPAKVAKTAYALEYGEGVLEMHVGAIAPGEKVLIVDDLLATGGTAKAAAVLARGEGGTIVGYSFLVELAFLEGQKKLDGALVKALLTY